MKFLESASIYFTHEKHVDGVKGVMESSRVAAAQSTSAAIHIGNREQKEPVGRTCVCGSKIEREKAYKEWKETHGDN